MDEAEFDRHASNYQDLHRVNVALTGEDPKDLSDYKMRDFAEIVRRVGIKDAPVCLDFGCGIGASIQPFQKYLPGAKLLAADVSGESLALAKKTHGDAAQFVEIVAGRLPLEARTVDAAFACCVFHHIPPEHQTPALEELRRVLKPGAPLMIYEHNPLNPLTVRAVRTCPFDENAILIRAGNMRRLVRSAGFERVHHSYRLFFPAMLARLRPAEAALKWLPLGAQYFVTARA